MRDSNEVQRFLIFRDLTEVQERLLGERTPTMAEESNNCLAARFQLKFGSIRSFAADLRKFCRWWWCRW